MDTQHYDGFFLQPINLYVRSVRGKKLRIQMLMNRRIACRCIEITHCFVTNSLKIVFRCHPNDYYTFNLSKVKTGKKL